MLFYMYITLLLFVIINIAAHELARFWLYRSREFLPMVSFDILFPSEPSVELGDNGYLAVISYSYVTAQVLLLLRSW